MISGRAETRKKKKNALARERWRCCWPVPCGRQHDLKERTHDPAYKLAETEKFLIKSHKEELTESGGNTTTLRGKRKKKKKKRACATTHHNRTAANSPAQQTTNRPEMRFLLLEFALQPEDRENERGGGWVSKSKLAWRHNQKDDK
jgi:hypothetical protein